MIERSSQTPAAGVSHVDALPPGTRLAEFEILGLLGVGGFGMVYKAFDHSLHRAVAIKEYMPTALAGRVHGQSLGVRSSSDQQTFQAGLASFVGEARLLAQFDHPSLVKVFRFWEANNTAYMVMPLYSGMTFKQARAQMRTPPPEAWLRKVLWSVLGALRVLHDGKTLHRDISPDNIFLQDYGPPVLLDLGAARHAINDQGRQHTAVLKVNYAPIEQYSETDDDLRQGPWSDLYSLAAVVHGCAQLSPVPGRMEQLALPGQPLVAVDYAHTPDALEKALQALRPLAQQRGGQLWCVFGCGGDRDASKRPLMGAAAQHHADWVVATSDNPRSEDPAHILHQILQGTIAGETVRVEPDRAAAIALALNEADPADVVLIAGKGHEDYQEVAGVRRPFSDMAQARAALQARGGSTWA